MPRVETSVKTADGQTIVLSPADKIVKEVTIECCSNRCASRHGQEKPVEVTLVEGEPMPEAGDQWMSLILPERSPQYTPLPPNFCSPQCAKDFLTYGYLAPAPRIQIASGEHINTETVQPTPAPVNQADGSGDPGDEHQ